MTFALIRKLLRDVRLPLLVVALLLFGFECLWAKVTQRITEEVIPALMVKLPLAYLKDILFQGPGKLVQTIMGGEQIRLDRAADMLSIGLVHPLTVTILCVWAVGRATGAIAGEIDRGTMELLLAQPLARFKLLLAHFCVDCLVIPLLCLTVWAGLWTGTWLVGSMELGAPIDSPKTTVDPSLYGPGLWNTAALMFAVSGYTMWLSACGRQRGKVMGLAVLVTLLQFLINVIGQLWDTVAKLRIFNVFYYYQPQQIVLSDKWTIPVSAPWPSGPVLGDVYVLAVLASVGALGYGLALWTFCRRDLPAPL
jgi:ABC-2 type transport system permease protein